MDYSRAIRIGRSLADVPQRELAERVSADPSLISMIESGKRKPTRELLERIAKALDIPFHLFALLATEPQDLNAGRLRVASSTGHRTWEIIVERRKACLRKRQNFRSRSSTFSP